MAKQSLRQRLTKRFVVISEIIGYSICTCVTLFMLWSYLQEVEIIVEATGTLQPPCVPVELDEPSVAVENLVETGETVAEGQVLCRVAVDPAEQSGLLAARHLAKAIAALEEKAEQNTSTQLTAYRSADAAVPRPASAKDVTSPASGVFSRAAGAGDCDITPAGHPIAHIYDLSSLKVETNVSGRHSEQLAAGQTARVVLEDSLEPLVGVVSSARVQEDGTYTIRASFADLPEDLSTRFRPSATRKELDFPTVTVRIVVDQRSLFSQLFGRS